MVYQCNKTEQLHLASLLQPLDVPTTVWVDIAIDFVEGLPKVKGKSVILTVVDRFSKAAHFLPLGHPYTATSVARVFFDATVKINGITSTIVSDCDPVFTGHFWNELFAMAGVKLQFTPAFHPQADGQSEATNKIVAMYLRCLTGDRPRQWLQWLLWAEYSTTPRFKHHSVLRRSRSCMDATLPHYRPTLRAKPDYRQSTRSYRSGMSSSLRYMTDWSRHNNITRYTMITNIS
jgi:hypothetical protein